MPPEAALPNGPGSPGVNPKRGLGSAPARDIALVVLLAVACSAWIWAAQDGLVPGRAIALGIAAAIQGLGFLAWGVLGWRIARRRDGWERTAWRLFAAAVPLTVIGFGAAAAAGLRVSLVPSGDPMESAVTILLYMVIFAGLLALGYGQSGSKQAWRRGLDAAIISGCLFFILWGALYRDQFGGSGLAPVARVLLISYPFFDAALVTLAALALGVPDPTRPKAYGYLLAGLVVTFAGDVVGTYLILRGSPLVLPTYTATGTAGMALIGLSAWGLLHAPPWQTKGDPHQPLWARMLPLAAVTPAMGSAVVTIVEHGALSRIQFWAAFAVVGVVLVQLGLTVQRAFRLEDDLRGESAFKTRLLRFISHEMANPLSPLRVQVALLRQGADEKRQHNWQIVDRSVERLMSLSTDVREMALAETQRLLANVEVADAGAQAAAAAQSAAPLAQQRGLELIVHSSVEVLPVRIDQQRFGQVLDNLFSNALKFTQKPGRITMRVEKAGNKARIQLTDTGIGLSAADQEGLFQPFRRAQDGMAPGLGLGLYLCRAIMAELHGEIGVESAGRGQGATFWVTLPLDGTPESLELALGPTRAAPARTVEDPAPTVTVKLS